MTDDSRGRLAVVLQEAWEEFTQGLLDAQDDLSEETAARAAADLVCILVERDAHTVFGHLLGAPCLRLSLAADTVWRGKLAENIVQWQEVQDHARQAVN